MKWIVLLLPCVFVWACSPDGPNTNPAAHPFLGCWQNENGRATEIWTYDSITNTLVGAAENRNETGEITFSETMEINLSDVILKLLVRAGDEEPVTFTRADTDNSSLFRFENSDHDFPQVIVYEPSDGRLDAYIDFIQGGNRIDFKKRMCD